MSKYHDSYISERFYKQQIEIEIIKQKLHANETILSNVLMSIDNKLDKLDSKIDVVYNKLNDKIDKNYNKLDSKIDENNEISNNKVDVNYYKLDNKIDSRFNLLGGLYLLIASTIIGIAAKYFGWI